MHKLFASVLALGCIIPLAGHAGELEDANAALDHWKQAFDAGDLDRLVASYETDAHLLGTMGGKLLVGKDAIRGYFAAIPKGFHVTFAEHEAQMVSNGVVVETGYYEFAGQDADGAAMTLPARFSFVVVKHGGDWLIANQHSSRRAVPVKQ
jgi:uncharacterized protein (TIGR02246 family)